MVTIILISSACPSSTVSVTELPQPFLPTTPVGYTRSPFHVTQHRNVAVVPISSLKRPPISLRFTIPTANPWDTATTRPCSHGHSPQAGKSCPPQPLDLPFRLPPARAGFWKASWCCKAAAPPAQAPCPPRTPGCWCRSGHLQPQTSALWGCEPDRPVRTPGSEHARALLPYIQGLQNRL